MEEAPKPEPALAGEIPANREATAATAMNDNEAILVELRKISAWAERQRKVTKWSLVFLAVFIPALIGFAILMDQQVSTKLEDTAPSQKPDWYEVEHNARQGNFDKAIGIGEELIVKTPQSPDAHKRLAGVYLAAGKLDKAREHYAEAFRLFPSEENEKLFTAIDKRCSAEKP
jgi:tetratricopeptide (TPR) repeat protein